MFTLTLLYGVIVLVLLVGAFFILYHIFRYSLSNSLRYFGALIFGVVFLLLLGINYVSFQAVAVSTKLPTLKMSPLLELPTGTLVPSKNNPW